jgi:hypothetical protein
MITSMTLEQVLKMYKGAGRVLHIQRRDSVSIIVTVKEDTPEKEVVGTYLVESPLH